MPYRGQWSTRPTGKQAVTSSRAKVRAVGERADAAPESWRLLRELRCSATHITGIVRAVLAVLAVRLAPSACAGCGLEPSSRTAPPVSDSKGAPRVADVRVTYDKTVDAAYVYLTEPRVRVKSARMYPCDPVDVDGMINLDFDEQGRLIGIEVLAASSKLPAYLLQSAERLDAEGS